MTHFLGCLERYLRTHAIQEATVALERSLFQLVESLGAEGSTDFDVLEQVRRLHNEHLHRLCQDCLLAPSLRSVLHDMESLIELPAALHHTLEGLVLKLRQNWGDLDGSTELGSIAESAPGVDEEEGMLDLESEESIRWITVTSTEVAR